MVSIGNFDVFSTLDCQYWPLSAVTDNLIQKKSRAGDREGDNFAIVYSLKTLSGLRNTRLLTPDFPYLKTMTIGVSPGAYNIHNLLLRGRMIFN